MAERRLAITIKGAVSLGAYEAGAIFETLRLIAYNNAQPGATPWYIDALGGASAGSITAALLAAALVRGDTDVMQRTWVTGVSLDVLAPVDEQMSDDNILDALSLDGLARANITCPTIATPHGAMRPAPASISLRFTHSHLYPSILSADTLNSSKLFFSDYKDWADFSVGVVQSPVDPSKTDVNISCNGVAAAGYHNASPALTGADAWSALVQAAIASGSFPFAFAPRDLRKWVGGGWMDQYFLDGGIYDNDPVGQTINIAHDIDWAPTPAAANYDDVDRRFLIIHTEPFDDSAREVTPNATTTLDLNPLVLAEKLFPAILEESETSGLRGIVTVNNQITERTNFLQGIANLIQGGGGASIPPAVLTALANFRKLAGNIPFFRTNMIPDLAAAAPGLYAQLSGFAAGNQASFVDLALAYDLATNLADKTKVEPIVIAPDDALSGSGLYAFGGFLVQRMRERDFAQGAYDAFEAWLNIAATQQDFLINPDPNAAPPKPATAADLLPQCQNEYENGVDRLLQRVDRVIAALSSQASGGGFLGGAQALAMRTVLNAVANHYVRKAASGS
jgi:predicted acylesterase/phospholipase RssA